MAISGEQASACDPGVSGGAVGGSPTAQATKEIPANLLPIYIAAQTKYGVPWNILASINKEETGFGTNTNMSSAGAIGWMQFMPATWALYGVDANGDGKKDPFNPEDAIFGAANLLKAAAGDPPDWNKAVFAYNHSDAYVKEVVDRARAYAQGDFTLVDSPVATCTDASDLGTGGDPDAEALAKNKNITWSHPGPELSDLRSGRVSPRLIALLSLIASKHKISVFALASDHAPGTNHEAGRAVDIWMVDGDNCFPPRKSGHCWQLAQELDPVKGCLHSTELIYYFDPGPSPDSFAKPDHDDHIHVGYDGPLGPKHYKPGTTPCSSLALTGTG